MNNDTDIKDTVNLTNIGLEDIITLTKLKALDCLITTLQNNIDPSMSEETIMLLDTIYEEFKTALAISVSK